MAKYNTSDILSRYRFTALRGRYFNDETAIKHFYRDNYTLLEPGLEEYRDRLGLPASTSLEQLFRNSVDDRLSKSKAKTVRGAFIDALKNAIVKDVHRSEITKRGFMESWSTGMGKVEQGPRGRGRPSKESLIDKSGENWKQFVVDSGWSGSVDDYTRLEHEKDGSYIYTNEDGNKFLITYKYYQDGGFQPTYIQLS